MEKPLNARNAKLQAMDKYMDKVWKAKKLPTLYPQFCPQPSASISRHQ
jgi:hypothetical protein